MRFDAATVVASAVPSRWACCTKLAGDSQRYNAHPFSDSGSVERTTDNSVVDYLAPNHHHRRVANMSLSLHKVVARSSVLLILVSLFGCAHEPEKPLTPEDVMNQPDARLRSIILTKVEIVNMPLDDALRYLTEQAQLADPDKKGVTIVYRSFNLNTLPPRIYVRFQQATVMQVLDEVCRQARCNYMIGKDGITVLPESMFKSSGPAGGIYRP